MITILAILALVFAHITYKDVTVRLVYRRDLIVLVALRAVLFVVAVVGTEVFGVNQLLTLDFDQWGIRSLVMSIAMAFIVMAIVQSVAFITNRLTNKYGAKDESLGLGDVKLYAVCCLFLSFDQAFIMLFLSALIGAAVALYVKVIKKERTFPFAPAIVWSTFVVLVLNAVGLL